MNEQAAISLVQDMIEHWGPTKERILGSFDRYFTAETVWENVGLAITTGRDEAKALIEEFPFAFDHMAVDITNIAAAGSVVMVERLDHFMDEHGVNLGSIRVVGVLETADGHIVRWREYFDTVAFTKMVESIQTGDPVL